MELASVLAGERWSDHPVVHPSLARGAGQAGQRPQQRRRAPATDVARPVNRRPARERPDLARGRGGGRREHDPRRPRGDAARAVRRSASSRTAVRRRRARARGNPAGGAVGARKGSRCGRLGRAARGAAPDQCEDLHQVLRPTMVRCAVEGVVASGSPDCDRRLRALLEVGIVACSAPDLVAPPPLEAQSQPRFERLP